MKPQPSIETERLILRPLDVADSSRVQSYAGDYRVAEMTENIPHPYESGMAEMWIESVRVGWEAQNHAAFAVCMKDNQKLIGCCGLRVINKHKRGTLGYWIGAEYWSKGLCTEAAASVVAFGFDHFKLRRIEAMHLTKNPASGAVMKNIGMKHEATMDDYVLKENVYQDMELYSILS